jgi:tetratricopeptide (TPR) repeat protein
VNEHKQEASAIAMEVCQARLRSNVRFPFGQFGSSLAQTFVVVVASAMLHSVSLHAASLDLTADQKQRLLAEAVTTFHTAIDNQDSTQADDQFRSAADSFQLLVDAGIENDRLYFNLAEAELHAQQVGRAIAYYRRALRLDPDNAFYHRRLVAAEEMTRIPRDKNVSNLLWGARYVNDQALRWISPTGMLVGFAIAWLAFWTALSFRLLRITTTWKAFACVALTLAIVCGGSYLLRVSEFTRDHVAVLVSPSISLREGDGAEFPELAMIHDQQGKQVKVLEKRGGWLHISANNGHIGWVRNKEVVEI